MNRIREQASGLATWAKTDALQFNFYRAHLFYFVVSVLVSSVIFWGSSTDPYHVQYTDALTMCASAMTNCGLTTIDLSAVNAYQQSILFVLMALGDLSIASISIVWVRRYFFGKKIHKLLKQSKAARRLAKDIEEQHQNRQFTPANEDSSTISSGASHPRQSAGTTESSTQRLNQDKQTKRSPAEMTYRSRRVHNGYGGLPSPWETDAFRRFAKLPSQRFSHPTGPDHHYLSFSPKLDDRGRFHSLTSGQLEELGGVEYRALGVLLWLLPAYTMFWLCFSWVILIPYTIKSSLSNVIRTSQPGNTSPAWWALFIGLSSYSNTGLDLLDQNMIPLNHDYLILIITGAAVLGGNTFYPILLRFTIWTMSKFVPKHCELHHSLAFLLHHPRRCFLFLFPGRNTWYIFGIQFLVFMLIWLAFEILNLGYEPLLSQISEPGQRTMTGLYQTVGVRSSGFYIVSQSDLSPACQIFFMVNMYISAIPFIVSLRTSNIYEERSIGMDTDEDKDPDNRSKSQAKAKQAKQNSPSIQTHLSNQLAYDLWWIVLAVFLIAIIERGPLASSSPGYSLFSVIFEVVSAYGTVGLSLGLPYANTSFCGAWHRLSKLVLITVMIRGRHRILPLAIDRAVLLPGQDLMERLDREETLGDSEHKEAVWKQNESEIQQEESGEQAENGGRQDPERSEGQRPAQGKTRGQDDSNASQSKSESKSGDSSSPTQTSHQEVR